MWIPQQNADGVGLRHVISQGDARKIFTLLGDGTIDQHPNWKGRFKENSDKMRTGSLYEVAVVLKGLTFLARKKSLSFREKRMLDRAKFLLISEIAEVEGKTQAPSRSASTRRWPRPSRPTARRRARSRSRWASARSRTPSRHRRAPARGRPGPPSDDRPAARRAVVRMSSRFLDFGGNRVATIRAPDRGSLER